MFAVYESISNNLEMEPESSTLLLNPSGLDSLIANETIPQNELNPLFDQCFAASEIKNSFFLHPLQDHPHFIDEVEPYEPIYTAKENITEECLRRENERAENQAQILNRVVYDCLEPSPFQEQKSATEPYYILKSADDPTLIFESRFESGNLRRATQIFDFEYDLILRWDLNTKGNMQWFYFSVANMRKGQKYIFNIINLLKPDSLYNQGMKPCVYSENAARMSHTGWTRMGQDICYYQNTIKKPQGGCYFTLTFSITAEYDRDTLFLAHCYPYTYTDLLKYLDSLSFDMKKRNRLRRKTLCQTCAGNNCDMLIITTFNTKAEIIKHRKGVVLFARVHPGESNASWMMKGVIDFLTGPTLQAKILRDNFVFRIVPMLNPDGVIFGNNRCGQTGVDLNRCWLDPSKKLHPTIYYAKAMVKQFSEENEIVMACDFHGHSRKKNIFMYGCVGKTRNRERIFPKLLEKISDVVWYNDCVFGLQKAKEATARIVLYKEFGIVNSFTMEASFCGANFGKHTDFHFNQEHFQQLGHDFCEALLDFCSPDQGKVKIVMEELEVMNPFEEEIADEGGEDEESKKRKKAKKPVVVKKRMQIKQK
jgi:cytosolic carboxypeptidase protein 2/3